jgi:hypothetical protein
MTIESFTKNNRAKESMDSSFIEKSSIQRNYTLLNSRSIIIDGKHAHKITIKIFKILIFSLRLKNIFSIITRVCLSLFFVPAGGYFYAQQGGSHTM